MLRIIANASLAFLIVLASCSGSNHAIPSTANRAGSPSGGIHAASVVDQNQTDGSGGCLFPLIMNSEGNCVNAISKCGPMCQFRSECDMVCQAWRGGGFGYVNPIATVSGGGWYTPVQIEDAIYKKAQDLKCKPGSGVLGLGCALTVNNVLSPSIGHTIPQAGDRDCDDFGTSAKHQCSTAWVPDVVQTITRSGGYGQEIPADTARAGDLVVQNGKDPKNGMNHIGICENDKCTQVLSNEGSIGELCGESNNTFSDGGYTYSKDQTPTFYRIDW